MAKSLPSTPNLEHLKKQAKQLVHDHQAGEVEAFNRIKSSFPKLMAASVHEIIAAEFSRCNAQLVVAREYGYVTWKELVAAVEEPGSSWFKETFIGEHPSLEKLGAQIAQVAPSGLPVQVFGESGTGKALVARAIHRASGRKGSFVQVDCSIEPEVLVDSELFGHEPGSFTGANARKIGKVEAARGGTLFLDEVVRLAPITQSLLFRLLEEGTYQRLGGDEVLTAEVCVITATNRDLDALVAEGVLRQDLAYWLQKIVIPVPPLRERPDDIPQLAAHFMAEMAVHRDKETPRLSPESEAALKRYDWPGNVRELQHRVQRAVALATGPEIGRKELALE